MAGIGSFVTGLFGGGLAATVEAVGKTVGQFVTTDKERQAGELELYRAHTERSRVEQAEHLAQVAVNQQEAQHRSVFVAGWRPFVGWTCAVMLVLHVGILPLAEFVLAIVAPEIELPVFDITTMIVILGGLLGIKIPARSFEKARGVARQQWRRAPG